MIALKETTKWDKSDFNVPNHTYILNNKQELVAYVKAETGEFVEFKKPIKGFTKSRRTFKEIEYNSGGPF